MLTCQFCRRRTIRSLATLHLRTAQFDFFSPTAITKTISSRNHATIASIQKSHHLRVLGAAFRSTEEIPTSKRERLRGPGIVSRRNMRAKENNRHLLNITKDDDTHKTLSKYSTDPGLRTELSWTGGDALKLAKSVLDKLKAGDPLKALDLVRLSEKLQGADGKKGVDSVVSWNHIMDYFMSQKSTREAFKVFNEVGDARLSSHAVTCQHEQPADYACR
jgi:pentatricopeptide repeat protein